MLYILKGLRGEFLSTLLTKVSRKKLVELVKVPQAIAFAVASEKKLLLR